MADNRPEIQELKLEDIMGERFGRYSKYIIQERALPDLRDGLKPVQRRILYAMYTEGNTFDKAYRKSAKTVGNVIGNYHPHGDSSVYDAMARMSQEWKMRLPLIDMHGNNGSMDGDPPAAMRYTEARLSKIANELIDDIDKETVEMVLNFDDTLNEPTVLPARYPNLLVNGATGISAGYATDIPPHNLNEVIDATIHLVKDPDASTKDLMEYIKGPDFPTGGIVQGVQGLQKAYETGKGKVIVRSKTAIESIRGGKEEIVITEIPFEVNKSNLVRKMDEIRINKKIDGIADVRDETDRTGLRIVVELKKDAQSDGILTYLLKNTDLQVSYNLNMIAINEKRPEQVGLKTILSSYLNHKKEVILKRTRYLLRKAEHRHHVVEGLIKAISILDDVIQVIRGSKNKSDAKKNIIKEFDFTDIQAEAIVSLQLYRLTNTDITQLEKEEKELNKQIKGYNQILSSEKKLYAVVEKELKATRDKFPAERLTKIENRIEELKVEEEVLVSEEDVMVSVTKEGYVKRTSIRSFKASEPGDIGMKESDYVIYGQEMSTLDQLLIFTNKGNLINRKVHELADIRWKDAGEHLSQSLSLEEGETVLKVFPVTQFDENNNYVFITRNGHIKQTVETEFEPKRTYKSRSANAMKLKTDEDVVQNIYQVTGAEKKDVFLVSRNGYGLRYPLEEVSLVGANAAGVKSMNLKEEDYIVDGMLLDSDSAQANALIVTQRGAVKKMDVSEFDLYSRAKRGLLILRELKTNPHRVALLVEEENNEEFILRTDKSKDFDINASDYKVSERYNNGSFILDENTDGSPILSFKTAENTIGEGQSVEEN